jgi:hypothetical protein
MIESIVRLTVQTAILMFMEFLWLAEIAVRAGAGDFLHAGYLGIGLLGATATFLIVTDWGAPVEETRVPQLLATRAWVRERLARAAEARPSRYWARSRHGVVAFRTVSH